jgi:hypothetical protein
MSEIQQVKLSLIDNNPMRRTQEYPFVETKIETLRQSIRDVGLWEGIIGRQVRSRVQIAFGHHRKEAAIRELGENAKVPVIIRDLDDREMIKFMGRENLEEFNADFLIMLESWEAAEEFLRGDRDKTPQIIDIARLLGWVKNDKANNTAHGCSDASALIKARHMARKDLRGLSVWSVRELCGQVTAQHRQIEQMAKRANRPHAEIERTKSVISKAAKTVASGIREGAIAKRDIRGELNVESYRTARIAPEKAAAPLFAMFAGYVLNTLEDLGKGDKLGEKLHAIQKALGDISLDEDLEVVRRVATESGNVAKRFEKWKIVFTNPTRKVTPLKQIAHQKD